MNVAEVLKKERISLSLGAKDKEDALRKMTELLDQTGALADPKAFLEDVLKREEISTTGIGNGIAIPHGKSESVKETTVAIAKLDAPIAWESVDDKPVKLVVLLAVGNGDQGGNHVRLLSQIARKLASEETCQRLLAAKDADELIAIFSE